MAADHPDRAWVEATVAALGAWLDVETRFPTSQITGGGAVDHVEQRLSVMHGGRPVLLVPSATYGMRSALAAIGVRAGDEVMVPQLDWSATLAAVRSLGAIAVCVPVSSDLTIDPEAAAAFRTSRTRAAVACHLLGVPADVPALRRALPGAAIVEDCAQAFGSTLDGERVGTLADAAVFSFGPGKVLDVGEAGAVVVRTRETFEALLGESTHPARQRVLGVDPQLVGLTVRVHPVAAVLLDHALDRADVTSLVTDHRRLAGQFTALTGVRVLGADARRGVASRGLAVDSLALSSAPPATGWTQERVDVIDIDSAVAGVPVTHSVTLLRRERRPGAPAPRAACPVSTSGSNDDEGR